MVFKSANQPTAPIQMFDASPKQRRRRSKRSTEVLDQIYNIDASQHMIKVDFIQSHISELKGKIAQAKTPAERDTIARNINKLTKLFVATLS